MNISVAKIESQKKIKRTKQFTMMNFQQTFKKSKKTKMSDLTESFKKFIIFSKIVSRVFNVIKRKKKIEKKFVFKTQKTMSKNHFTKRIQLEIKKNSKLSQYDDDFHVYFKLISIFRSSIQ